MNRIILHIDMDAFYASIEQRDNPLLKNKPVAVGGKSNRGVISTASYEARKYGVHSAMPVKRALFLCPNLKVVNGNIEKYKSESKRIYNILKRYGNKIEKLSIDEAFLDITGKDYKKIIKAIKRDLKNELNLTASIGVSYNKFLAKLASDIRKPDGLTIIREESALDILKPLPINKIFGVGETMEDSLNKLGIYYVQDIQNYNKDILFSKFGKKGIEIYEYSNARDYREVSESDTSQSIGEEETFISDVDDKDILYYKLYEHSIKLDSKIRSKYLMAGTITVKIKYIDFKVETRSMSLSIPISKREEIYKYSKYIVDNKFEINRPVRLIGITLSNLIYPEDPHQLRIL